MLSALRLVVLRARQDTWAFFGWNYGTLSVPIAFALGLWIRYRVRGFDAAVGELVGTVLFGVIPVVALGTLLFVVNMFLAPLRQLRDAGEREEALREKLSTLEARPRPEDVLLQALVGELEFNQGVAARAGSDQLGATLRDDGFRRANAGGAFQLLPGEMRTLLNEVYALADSANQQIAASSTFSPGSNSWANCVNKASKCLVGLQPKIATALQELTRHSRS